MNLPIPEALAGRFDALWQWLSRQYELELVPLEIGSHRLAINKIANPDAALDKALRKDPHAEGAGPYWAELWPSALGLAQFLERLPDFHNVSAIELGCGLGVSGIFARRKGAAVLLSDVVPDALRIAELNWILNIGEVPQTTLLDWRNPAIAEKFDLIFASDVAYEPLLFPPLINTFRQLLHPAGRIYLSEPNRPVARDFFAALSPAGFKYHRFAEAVDQAGKIVNIAIYEIRHAAVSPDFGN